MEIDVQSVLKGKAMMPIGASSSWYWKKREAVGFATGYPHGSSDGGFGDSAQIEPWIM